MRTSRSSRLFLFTLTGAALLAVNVPAGAGADPFVAGGLSTRPMAVGASQSERAVARGAELARALGLPGVRRHATRLDDRFEHRVYDEVVSVDQIGRDVSIARFDVEGRPIMALVLGWEHGRGQAIGRDQAASRGAEIVRLAGVEVAGTPDVRESAGAGGWSVAWARSVDRVPVRGDGVRVALWRDGSFHGLTRSERPLAAVPASRVSAVVARRAAEGLAARHFEGSAAGDLRVVSTELAWIAPNDTWAPQLPDAPAELLRLAWIVRFESRGGLTDRVRVVEYWIDAGDGSLLGGDVVE
jgi:hypothetical protein